MNIALIINACSMAPAAVLGIEQLITEAKSGATKKQLAMDALGFSTAVADNVDPAIAPMADAASALVSKSIDMWVSFFNRGKVFSHTVAAALKTADAQSAGAPMQQQAAATLTGTGAGV